MGCQIWLKDSISFIELGVTELTVRGLNRPKLK